MKQKLSWLLAQARYANTVPVTQFVSSDAAAAAAAAAGQRRNLTPPKI